MNKLGFVISFILLSVIIVFFIIRYILIILVDKRIANYENDLVSKQYSEIENTYKQIRGWKHDYHNHIQVMKAYLSLERYEDMDKYLDELSRDLTEIDTV